MIPRTLFDDEHELFRNSVKKFAVQEIVPYLEQWDHEGAMDPGLWQKAGDNGFLCCTLDEKYGGSGVDRSFSMILLEELSPLGGIGISFAMHSEIVASYINRLAQDAVKQKYLPQMASGKLIGALAMSEPGAGSDVKAIRTSAVRDGDHYILNGSKTFISNGKESGIVIVVAKTDPEAGARGISLLLVDDTMAGFEKGKKLRKVGLKCQDTAELFFNDVRVPAENLLGEENQGFIYSMQELSWERAQLGIAAVACCKDSIQRTIEYVTERKAFGQSVANFQNTRFKLAELQTEVQIAEVFVDRCMELELKGELDDTTAAMMKYWTTDLQCKVADECVQLHGGYGFMQEYEIARAWVDSRAQRIYGGTNEIMKELISRSFLGK